MVLDFDGWFSRQPEDTRSGISSYLNAVPEPGRAAAKQKLASMFAIAESRGFSSVQDVRDNWETVRGGVAEENGWLNEARTDDAAFFGELRKKTQFEKDERHLVYGPESPQYKPLSRFEMTLNAVTESPAGRMGVALAIPALSGRSLPSIQPEPDDTERKNSLAYRARAAALEGKPVGDALSEWQMASAGKPGFSFSAKHFEIASAEHEKVASTADEVRPRAMQIYDAIEKARTGGDKLLGYFVAPTVGRSDAAEGFLEEYEKGKEGADVAPVKLFRGMTPEQKQVTFEIMDLRAGELGAKKLVNYIEAQALAESVYRGGENLIVGGGAQKYRAQLLSRTFKEGDMVNAPGPLEEIQADFAYAMRIGSSGGTPAIVMTAPIGKEKLTAEKAAEWNQKIDDAVEDLDTAEQARKFGQDVIDPTDRGNVVFRKIIRPVGDSAAIMASMAIPGMQYAAFEYRAHSYANDDYMRLRAQGMDARTANQVSVTSGMLEAGLDFAEFGLLTKGAPNVTRALREFSLRGSQLARLGANAGGVFAGENAIEITQDIVIPALVQDALTNDPKWNVKTADIWSQIVRQGPDIAMGMVLLSGLAGIAQTRGQNQVIQEAPESLLYASGYTEDQAKQVLALPPEQRGEWFAQTAPAGLGNPVQQAQLAIAASARETATFNERQRVEAAAMSDAEDYGIRVTRSGSGWWVTYGEEKSVRVDSLEAARAIHEDLKQAATEAEAQAAVEIVDRWGGRKTEGDAKTLTFTGEKVVLEGGENVSRYRLGQKIGEVTDAAYLGSLRDEARAVSLLDGTEDIDIAINGTNEVFRSKVFETTRGMIQRLEVNESESLVLSVLHETIEADLRAGVQSGLFTRDETARAVSAVAAAFDPSTARDEAERTFRERVQSVARGEANEDAMRETITELVVAEAIGRRKDGGAFKAGSISKALSDAMKALRSAEDIKAVGKFRATLRAARQFFRAVFGTLASLQKARRDGKVSEEWEGFVQKLLGVDEQAEYDTALESELAAYIPPTEEEQAAGIAFSLSPGAVGDYLKSRGLDANTADHAASDIERDYARATALREDEGTGDLFEYGRRLASAGGLPDVGRTDAVQRGRSENAAIGSLLDPQAVGEALESRGRVSSVIHQLITREIPGFDIAGQVVRTAEDFAKLLIPLRSPYFESLKIAFVDQENRVIHSQILHVGSLSESIASPRDMLTSLEDAKRKNPRIAGALIAHNHPSGNPNPSTADIQLTERVGSAFALAEIELVDHVITNGDTFYSFRSQTTGSIDGAKLADWEVVGRNQLLAVGGQGPFAELISSLRQSATAEAVHIIYLNTKLHVIGVERTKEAGFAKALVTAIGREAPASIMIDASGLPAEAGRSLIYQARNIGQVTGVRTLEAATSDIRSWNTAGLIGERSNLAVRPKFRLTAGAGLEALQRRMDAVLANDPDARRNVKRRAIDNLQKLQFNLETQRWTWDGNQIRPIVDKRTAKELSKEQAFHEAVRREELEAEVYARHSNIFGNEEMASLWSSPLMQALYRPEGGPLQQGRLRSKAAAGHSSWFDGKQGEYDGAEELPRNIFGGSLMPDQAAQELYDAGLLRVATPDALWDAIRKEVDRSEKWKEFVRVAQNELRDAKEQAKREAAEWRKDQEELQSRAWSAKNSMLRSLRALDAVLSAVSPELRGQVGGFVKLAALSTDAARFKEIGRRIDKLSVLLEKDLQNESIEALEKLIERAKPKGGKGEKLSGKIGVEGHRIFAEVERVHGMSKAEATGENAKLATMIAEEAEKSKAGEVSQRMLDLLEQQQIFDMFAHFEGKSAAEMDKAVSWLSDVYRNGRNAWREIEAQRAADIASIQADVLDYLGKYAGTTAHRQSEKKAKVEVAKMLENGTFDLLSWVQVLESLLEPNHSLVKRYNRMAREATAQKTDAILSANARWSQRLRLRSEARG